MKVQDVFTLRFFFAGEGQPGPAQLFGHAVAAQGFFHEGVGEIDGAFGGVTIGQLGLVPIAGEGELLVLGIVFNRHALGNNGVGRLALRAWKQTAAAGLWVMF